MPPCDIQINICPIATSIKTKDSDLDIWISDSEDQTEWALSNAYQTIKELQMYSRRKGVSVINLPASTGYEFQSGRFPY